MMIDEVDTVTPRTTVLLQRLKKVKGLGNANA